MNSPVFLSMCLSSNKLWGHRWKIYLRMGSGRNGPGGRDRRSISHFKVKTEKNPITKSTKIIMIYTIGLIYSLAIWYHCTRPNIQLGALISLHWLEYFKNLRLNRYMQYITDYGHPERKIAFTTEPKIQSQSQIFRYVRSIFCLSHRPNFSDFFDLCLHWVSVVRGLHYEKRLMY